LMHFRFRGQVIPARAGPDKFLAKQSAFLDGGEQKEKREGGKKQAKLISPL
jgi:hypothetical protein